MLDTPHTDGMPVAVILICAVAMTFISLVHPAPVPAPEEPQAVEIKPADELITVTPASNDEMIEAEHHRTIEELTDKVDDAAEQAARIEKKLDEKSEARR